MRETEDKGSAITGLIIAGVVLLLFASDLLFQNMNQSYFDLLRFLVYLLPFFPVIIRLGISLLYWEFMLDYIPEEAQGREVHRSTVLALMGFSFSGTVALLVVNAKVELNLLKPTYFLLVSFLSYFIVLNLQQYKAQRWQDDIGDGFLESGHFALILSVASLIWTSEAPNLYKYILVCMAILVWLVDFAVRIWITWRYLYWKKRKIKNL
jgi:hypothetical protein